MECPNCYYVAAPGEMAEEGTCPQCGTRRPEMDQPSGTSTDFQTFGMPAPGEDDGNQGNPLAEGTITGSDGERPWKRRDNFMGSVHPPLFFSASELPKDPEFPAEFIDVVEADDLPKKRKDRKLDEIESSFQKEAQWQALLARGLMGSMMTHAIGNAPVVGDIAKSLPVIGGLFGGGGGGGGQQQQPENGSPPVGPQDASYFSRTSGDEYDSPSSQSRIPGDTSDPEKVDTKEKNDGSDFPLQVGQDVNDMGGTDGFDPEGEAAQTFKNLWPKLVQFITSDKEGANDPEIMDLHNKLDAEQPGYLNDADDHQAGKVILMLVNEVGGGGHDPMNKTPDDEPVTSAHQALNQPGLQMNPNPVQGPAPVKAPSTGTRCPACGGTISAADPACPQCGSPNMNTMGKPPITAAGPWPANERGPGGEPAMMYEQTDIPPDMDVQTWNAQGRPKFCNQCGQPTIHEHSPTCFNCGALRTASGQGPQTDEQKAAVAQFLQDQGRHDEIPIMLLEPWKYADELAQVIGRDAPPDADPNEQAPPSPPQEQMDPNAAPASGGGMPVPGMSSPVMGAMVSAINRYSDAQLQMPTGENVPDVAAADYEHQEDPELEQDSGHTWTDDSGAPLRVGQEYEMYSANYDIPDLVRIEAVKPDSIEYTLTGEYGLEHRTEITREEAQIENLTFTPATGANQELGNQDAGLEQNMEDIGRPAPGQDQTDLSRPHSAATHKEGGAKFTLSEQRDFIEEAGVARNADKLDLAGTHYESSHVEVDHGFFLFGLP